MIYPLKFAEKTERKRTIKDNNHILLRNKY
jgi:hypothetical protein